ncbi:pre T-cell antigen receptor alpha [Gracilinanus agilis]|uniref:pre T-cell antigen receptor alpha n=1 Tax=Gracilinanus agilis TaxID=191870 RepID=UPI001CFC7170|nr:pre T-cell antigen receptor alpha [Gracilinanus agilis]
MAGPWLLLLLTLGAPALPTGLCTAPFPSMAPPLTLLVDGRQKTLVICLVVDVSPPLEDGSIWFSSGNGTTLEAFTYGPSPAGDGTWSSLAQLSLPAEELASWEPLVCHAGPGWKNQGPSTQPLQLSGKPMGKKCQQEPTIVPNSLSQMLVLEVIRLILFKLLLFDVLMTCNHLRMLGVIATNSPDLGIQRQGSRV